MKKCIFFIVIIIGLIVLNTRLIIRDKKELKYQDQGFSYRSFYENKFYIEKKHENLKLDKNMKFLTIEGDTVNAMNIFNKNKIVFRYSMLNCGACIYAEYEILKKNSPLIVDQICIIAYYDRVRDLIGDYKKLQQMGLNKVPIYLMLNDNLGIPMDENNMPYYFQINQDLVINNFFVPAREISMLSEKYLQFSLNNFIE